MTRSRTLRLAFPVVAVAVALVVWQARAGTQFTRAGWQDTALAYGPPYIRQQMLDDLLDEHRLAGRSRADVVRLLGEPLRTGYFRDWDLVYWLGPERGLMSVDSEWLVLRLDQEDRVMEYRVVTD